MAGGGGPVNGVVDHTGRPVRCRSTHGGWVSAVFIIGVEVAERCAYFGISSNLITYLTGPLRQSTAAAAASVNAWNGVAQMLPLLSGVVADSSLGRYRTIVIASTLYILSLGMLTLSAVLPSLSPQDCINSRYVGGCLPAEFRSGFFFFSLYLAGIAMAGHKPCVQAFGADQFDENDPKELKSRSSFFNWWYFGMNGGIIFALLFVNYVQEQVGWGLGFGLPFAFMLLSTFLFLLGSRTYRYALPGGKPLFRRNNIHGDENQALIAQPKEEEDGSVAGILRLFPIWGSCLMYAVAFAQAPTFFTKQGRTMERKVGPDLLVPPAALQSLISVAIVVFIPIYDMVLVPAARSVTGRPSGITMLQRIGTGLALSVASVVVAALVEAKRLRTAREFGLIDDPDQTVPMSLWWLVPQYVLYGASHVFAIVGLQELFYDQVPEGLRSLGLGLYLCIFGIGSFISSFLVSAIDSLSERGGDSWFADDLNRGHLDYFYWLIAGLSFVSLIFFVYFSRNFQYKQALP